MTIPSSASVLTGHAAPVVTAGIARGILAEPYPLAQVNASRTLATQAVLGVLVPVQAGTTVSGVAVCIETVAANGTLPTGVYVALYSVAGVQLAVSADVKAVANWNATGLFSFAFATAYAPPNDAAVYACILKNGVWGTEAKIATMTAVTGSGAALGSNAPGAVTQAAQATMPSPATFTANASYPWLALV